MSPENMTPDQVMITAMKLVTPFVGLSFCLTGQHYGVTLFRELQCPICR